MSRLNNIANLKTATKAILLLVVISLQGQFVKDSIGQVVKPEFKPMLAKHKNYAIDAHIESVKFLAKKSEKNSNETIERHGTLRIKNDAPATVLICHGYMCDKYDISFLRTVFNNYNVMTFDFRAHGEKIENQCCTLGKEEAFDVIGAVSYLKSRPELMGKPLIGYGFSMGAVSAIEAQSHGSLFDALILDCPFDSSDTLLKKGIDLLSFNLFGYEIPIPGRDLIQRYAYNPYVQSFLKTIFKAVAKLDATATSTHVMRTSSVESIESISVPCYFITCKNDEKVSVEAVTSIYAGAKGYKRLWVSNGRRHFDSFFFNPEKYTHKVNKFVNKVVSGKLTQDSSAKIVADQEA